MPHFPPPPELPQPVARFHRVPPAIFPPVLGLLGLVAAWSRAVDVFGFPAAVVDVHISNIYEREPFRQVNRLEDVCATSIVGQGLEGYRQAIEFLLEGT